MLEAARPLSQTSLGSALGGQSMLRPKGGKVGRMMVASLMLTSLVDAFSILVIFLIMNASTDQEVLNLGKGIELPKASVGQLIQNGVTVRIENNQFVVDEKPVSLGKLAATLKSLNASVPAERKEGLIIVADRDLSYEDLNPVIMAGSAAGFTKFKFAIIQE